MRSSCNTLTPVRVKLTNFTALCAQTQTKEIFESVAKQRFQK
ncbi:hypothetical protein Pse7429DRAFT_4341, partial [Pseudanabaena biceps PCC 7429]